LRILAQGYWLQSNEAEILSHLLPKMKFFVQNFDKLS